MTAFDARLLELASDILTAVGRGELKADAAVVRAAGAALAELRRPVEPPPPPAVPAPGVSPSLAAGGATGESRLEPGRRQAPPVEQVLAVAERMRATRASFAAACSAEGERLGVSAQAVRNACTRWLDVGAGDWQPLLVAGAEEGVLPLARRVVERCPWLRERVASAFGVPAARLDGAPTVTP